MPKPTKVKNIGGKVVFKNMPKAIGDVFLDISTPEKEYRWLTATKILIDYVVQAASERDAKGQSTKEKDKKKYREKGLR